MTRLKNGRFGKAPCTEVAFSFLKYPQMFLLENFYLEVECTQGWDDQRGDVCRRVVSAPTMFTCSEDQRRSGRPSSPEGKFPSHPLLARTFSLLHQSCDPHEKLTSSTILRKGFDVTMWRPLCSCKHPHAVHEPIKDRTKCRECNCSK